MTITFGADPELFLHNGQKYVSAIGRIGGSKMEPRKIGDAGCALQEDNVAVEYNIPPCKTPMEFVSYNQYMLGVINGMVAQEGLQAVNHASAIFDDMELDHPAAHVFGCEPDYGAWALEMNPPPHANNPNLRSCGGHIHVGLPKDWDNIKKIQLVRWLDATVGVALQFLEPENERAQLYGRPGAMRFKPYGIEWRTPSNYWLTSVGLMTGVVGNLEHLVNCVDEGVSLSKYVTEEEVQQMFKDKALTNNYLAKIERYIPLDLASLVYDKIRGSTGAKPAKTRKVIQPGL